MDSGGLVRLARLGSLGSEKRVLVSGLEPGLGDALIHSPQKPSKCSVTNFFIFRDGESGANVTFSQSRGGPPPNAFVNIRGLGRNEDSGVRWCQILKYSNIWSKHESNRLFEHKPCI